ncbi:MAG: MBL fold metallo-hydrolase [Myxococcales bacterium]|jgi:ribonuclease Z|nr:MBL fold metallo-hydrolase [Myxococcales bacterium]
MLTQVEAGPYTIKGVSVGGVYTSLCVPELDALFDVGIAPRSFVGLDHLFISHGHADHIGALPALMGVRGLSRKGSPKTFLPAPIVDDVREALAALSRIQRYELQPELIGVRPGELHEVHGDLHARVFKTYHPVPSVGYQLLRRVRKLRSAFRGLPGPEIARLRAAGDDIFEWHERLELAYATDTLIDVVDHVPSLLTSRVLVLECTFLDERKERAEARSRCHIHLDEILERADAFQNEQLVLMHFSQIYSPGEVRAILQRRCPPHLLERIVAFAPARGPWPG